MKKYRSIVLIVSALVLLAALAVLAACAPATVQPTQAPAEPTAAATPAAAAVATEVPPIAAEIVALTPDPRPVVPAPVEGQRPLAAAERLEAYSGPAARYVMSDTIYIATIVTDKGNIVAELYQDTPESLNNFVTLALNGFYDGLTFHRVEEGFVIQGGDPAGDGSGGPGYTIPAEIVHTHPRGALAWARTGDEINPERRSSGSQFYVTLDQTDFLDGAYTVFGYVIEGMEVADQIAVGDKIQRVDITTGTASLLPTPTPSPTPFAPAAAAGRPLATVTVAEREGYYNAAPAMTIDVQKQYQATLATAKGNVVIDLDAQASPITVNNFVMLANLGYYDGMPIAHVEAGTYMVLGSPASQPGSDVGYLLDAETPLEAATVVTGTVAMYPIPISDTEVRASGSQFFISLTALPPGSTPLSLFGKVSAGEDVLAQLAAGDVITQITITEK